MIKFNITDGQRDYGAIGTTHKVKGIKEVFNILLDICKGQPSTIQKDKLFRFIPSTFKGDRRIGEDFVETKLFGLDVDEGDPFTFLEKLTKNNISFIVFETPSSTPENLKYRIIVELSDYIKSITQFKFIYEDLFKDNVTYDKSCNDPSRLFYIPNISKIDSFYFNEGNPLSIKNIKWHEVKEEIKKENVEDDLSSFFLESGDIVEFKLMKILSYLKQHKLSITKTHKDWVAVCFTCVSLKNHNIAKSRCQEYFIQFSKLDGEKCESQEKLIEKFEYCWSHTQNAYAVSTIYHFAKLVGCPLPKLNPEIIKMLKAEEKGSYYLALNNTESDDIVALYPDLYSPAVARSKIKITNSAIFALTSQEIQHWDAEQEKFKYNEELSDFMARYIKQPDKICYLLGADKNGRFYEKSTNTLLTANHYKIHCKAVFHQDIHDWLSQLHIDIDWLYTYIYHVTDLSVAEPLIHCYGISNAGKTLLAKLIASIWSTPPIEDYIDEKGGFKDTAGSNPIILFDEKIPDRPDEIKNIVTSNMVSIRQKYKTAMYVKGYSRIFTAVNEDILHFPAFKSSDNGALLRRIQPIEFKQDNVDYLNKIGGITVTRSWLHSAFREHCKYIRENPQVFNLIKSSTDILAVSPIKTEHTDKHSFTFNKEHRVIQEYFYHEACKVNSPDKKECIVPIPTFFKGLLENKIINKRLSIQEIESILKKPLKGEKSVFTRDSKNNIPRWRVKLGSVISVLKDFGLDDDVVLKNKDEDDIEEDYL